MKIKLLVLPLAIIVCAAFFAVVGETRQGSVEYDKKNELQRLTQTRTSQAEMTPARALEMLKDGNKRFVENVSLNRNLRRQMQETADGQYPFATILGCQDSRTSNEQIFDLNKGDAFSIRIAGNVVNEDVLGGMEFGTKVAGSKLIVVLGHTKCGAVKGACDNVKLGNLTRLLDKIQPAVNEVPENVQPRNSKNERFVEMVAEANVREAMKQVRGQSPIVREMLDKGEIAMVGGIYDISTGKVNFFEK